MFDNLSNNELIRHYRDALLADGNFIGQFEDEIECRMEYKELYRNLQVEYEDTIREHDSEIAGLQIEIDKLQAELAKAQGVVEA